MDATPDEALYARMILAWSIISALSIAVAATLGGWLYNDARATCQVKNLELVLDNKQGPLRQCP